MPLPKLINSQRCKYLANIYILFIYCPFVLVCVSFLVYVINQFSSLNKKGNNRKNSGKGLLARMCRAWKINSGTHTSHFEPYNISRKTTPVYLLNYTLLLYTVLSPNPQGSSGGGKPKIQETNFPFLFPPPCLPICFTSTIHINIYLNMWVACMRLSISNLLLCISIDT